MFASQKRNLSVQFGRLLNEFMAHVFFDFCHQQVCFLFLDLILLFQMLDLIFKVLTFVQYVAIFLGHLCYFLLLFCYHVHIVVSLRIAEHISICPCCGAVHRFGLNLGNWCLSAFGSAGDSYVYGFACWSWLRWHKKTLWCHSAASWAWSWTHGVESHVFWRLQSRRDSCWSSQTAIIKRRYRFQKVHSSFEISALFYFLKLCFMGEGSSRLFLLEQLRGEGTMVHMW